LLGILTVVWLLIITEAKAQSQVKIGNQVWMAENLNVSTFRNGDPILEVKTLEEWVQAGNDGKPAWCYYNNDPKNGDIYGKIYNWFAVNDPRGLAPKGWHIPNYAEWTELSNFLGGQVFAGKKMKSTNGWRDNGNGNNSSGFSGLPGGFRFKLGFIGIGDFGFWWSSSESMSNSINATSFSLSFKEDLGFKGGNNVKTDGMSVRCVRD
ncbi:fibrobacter succinogenes major paralogous domain-containing protein, partial [Bacteroidota bacterium]